MSVYVQTNQIVNIPNAAAYAVSMTDTGKVHICPQTTVGVGDITVTLPAVAAGLHYRFINGSAAAAAANVIVQSAAAGLLNGLIIQLGATVAATRALAVSNNHL